MERAQGKSECFIYISKLLAVGFKSIYWQSNATVMIRLRSCFSICASDTWCWHRRVFWQTVSQCVCSEIRAQLVEQQKCLEQQTDMRVQLLQDLQDFFRKKSEIEMEYSRNLEKLAERFMAKTRSTKDHQQYKWVCISIWVLGYILLSMKWHIVIDPPENGSHTYYYHTIIKPWFLCVLNIGSSIFALEIFSSHYVYLFIYCCWLRWVP